MKIRKDFNFLFKETTKYMSVVAARGAGKTVAAMQFIVDRLMMGEPMGRAAFYSATLKQAATTTEPVMKQIMAAYPPGMWIYNSSSYKYTFNPQFNRKDIPDEAKDKREIFLLSYENEDSKRGPHPHTIVLDECGSIPHSMYENVVLLSLEPNNGKLLAIGTARDKSKFKELYRKGLRADCPEWSSYAIKGSNSSVFTKEYLDEMKKNLPPSVYAREIECDFDAGSGENSVYGEYIIHFVKANNNISDEFTFDPSLPVWTAWDIGHSNRTAIWFFQDQKEGVTFIDFFEGSKKDLSYYSSIVMTKPYMNNYRFAILPHDADHNDVRTPYTPTQILKKLGVNNIALPVSRVSIGIEKAKEILKTARFNKTKCEAGLEHLEEYRYAIDYKTGIQLDEPEHDHHSDAADAFRYAAMSEHIWKRKKETATLQKHEYEIDDGYLLL